MLCRCNRRASLRVCTLAALQRIAKASAAQSASQLWSTTAPLSSTELGIRYTPKTDELCLDRAALGRILAVRSHHGDFAAYHEHFHHIDALLYCSCGRLKSPLHFYFCTRSLARQLANKPTSEAIPWLLGTANGARKLAGWITASKYYTDVCPIREPCKGVGGLYAARDRGKNHNSLGHVQ